MEDHQLLLASPPHHMAFISHDHINHDYISDLIFPNYGHDLDELMFPDSRFAGNTLNSAREEGFLDELEVTSNFGFRIGALAETPNYLNLSEDGDAPVSGGAEDGDGDNNHGNSSATMKPRRDRTKTLVSDRRRRSRMKEELYELRSLVPNITKMDKASIISDAIIYVRNLQGQAKELEEEIAVLQTSARDRAQVFGVPLEGLVAQVEERRSSPNVGRILGVKAHEVGDGRLYVKVECSKGEGVASSLYIAIESLECFDLESSNVSMASERYVLTLIFKVKEATSASAVRLWVMGALQQQGFEFEGATIA